MSKAVSRRVSYNGSDDEDDERGSPDPADVARAAAAALVKHQAEEELRASGAYAAVNAKSQEEVIEEAIKAAGEATAAIKQLLEASVRALSGRIDALESKVDEAKTAAMAAAAAAASGSTAPGKEDSVPVMQSPLQRLMTARMSGTGATLPPHQSQSGAATTTSAGQVPPSPSALAMDEELKKKLEATAKKVGRLASPRLLDRLQGMRICLPPELIHAQPVNDDA